MIPQSRAVAGTIRVARNENVGMAAIPAGIRRLFSAYPGCHPLSRAYPGLTSFDPYGIGAAKSAGCKDRSGRLSRMSQ
jgi:hypothetical protein